MPNTMSNALDAATATGTAPPVALHPAAELSVRAHLVKLVAEGRVATDDGERFIPS